MAINGSPNLQNQVDPWRIYVFAALIGFVFLAFLSRLFTLQVIEGEDWSAQAQENALESFSIPAQRGVIYDRNGVVLARNVPSYNVVLTYANLPDEPGATQAIFRELSRLIAVPVSQGEISETTPYVPCISDHGITQVAVYGQESQPYQAVRIKCDIDETTAKIIMEKSVDWPGIGIEIQPIREYPTGSLTSNIIGFLGPIPARQEAYYRSLGMVPNRDKVGYAGVELQWQELLGGKNGLRVSQIDVAGQVVRQDMEPPVESLPGYNIRLTIDTRLQQSAEAIFEREIREWNQYLGRIEYSSGVVIAINPKTGEILAMVSYPSYENNRMARVIPAYYYNQLVEDPLNPLLNHAVGDVLPAGSVFKLVTAVGGLNEGVVEADQMVETPGIIYLTERYYENDPGTSRPFVDWIYQNGLRPDGFGQLDFIHALANSSNVYFYKVGGGYQDEIPEGLGICRLGAYANVLGYGDAPGILLPDEEDGLIPDPYWKRIFRGESWSSGDTYLASVGQGTFLTTPIQVLLSAAIVANDGKYMQPTLIREVLDGEGNLVNVDLYLDDDGNVVPVVEGRDDNPPYDPDQYLRPLSPFTPTERWDVTQDPVIPEFGPTTIKGCAPIEGSGKTIEPWVLEKVQEGMRLAVTEGTLSNERTVGFDRLEAIGIQAAGKTGTAEYCDKYEIEKRGGKICDFGDWPTHAWTLAFAPYEDPEIAVVAFVYNGGEGSSVAGPIVRQLIEAYFTIKAGK